MDLPALLRIWGVRMQVRLVLHRARLGCSSPYDRFFHAWEAARRHQGAVQPSTPGVAVRTRSARTFRGCGSLGRLLPRPVQPVREGRDRRNPPHSPRSRSRTGGAPADGKDPRSRSRPSCGIEEGIQSFRWVEPVRLGDRPFLGAVHTRSDEAPLAVGGGLSLERLFGPGSLSRADRLRSLSDERGKVHPYGTSGIDHR
jgi:hypothetical protein